MYKQGQVLMDTLPNAFRSENRNQDRNQCKPLRRRNSDLLTDSVAISIQYFTPTNPPPENIYREKERFLGEGGYRQMHAAESVNRSLFRRRKGLHWLLSWFLFSGLGIRPCAHKCLTLVYIWKAYDSESSNDTLLSFDSTVLPLSLNLTVSMTLLNFDWMVSMILLSLTYQC